MKGTLSRVRLGPGDFGIKLDDHYLITGLNFEAAQDAFRLYLNLQRIISNVPDRRRNRTSTSAGQRPG